MPLPILSRLGGGLGLFMLFMAFLVVTGIVRLKQEYQKGYEAGQAEIRVEYKTRLLEVEQQMRAALEETLEKEREMRKVEADAAARIEAALAKAKTERIVIREAIQNDEKFRDCVRPADVSRMRVEQLKAIAAASGGGEN